MKRILVVEDSPDIALVVKTTLEMHGFEVSVATDGLRGFEMAQTGRFDLVILDLLLPEIDGMEVLRRLKGNPATAPQPIALFSAQLPDEERKAALEAGAVAILEKPFDPRQLVRHVGALVGEKAA